MLQLILNLSKKTDEVMPSVNNTSDSEVDLESMQFGCASPHIIQEIWDADPSKGPVRVPKIDITDAYHWETLRPAHVSAFSYVIPSVDDDD